MTARAPTVLEEIQAELDEYAHREGPNQETLREWISAVSLLVDGAESAIADYGGYLSTSSQQKLSKGLERFRA